jgi:hypothetical protein
MIKNTSARQRTCERMQLSLTGSFLFSFLSAETAFRTYLARIVFKNAYIDTCAMKSCQCVMQVSSINCWANYWVNKDSLAAFKKITRTQLFKQLLLSLEE